MTSYWHEHVGEDHHDQLKQTAFWLFYMCLLIANQNKTIQNGNCEAWGGHFHKDAVRVQGTFKNSKTTSEAVDNSFLEKANFKHLGW